MTAWTKEQAQAIALRNRRLLVSAAAGSGKTAVLTERIVRRITDEADPLDIDELLVMTFTRAAASEMRERIRKRLEAALTEEASERGDTPRYRRLKRQTALIDATKITTIDSFCYSVIREHADLTDLDPAFRVGSEEELSLMRNDIAETLLEEFYAGKEERFLRFADSFSGEKSDEGIRDLILSVYGFSQSSPWPEEWLDACALEAERTAAAPEKAAASGWAAYLFGEIRNQAESYVGTAERALKLCGGEGCPAGYEDTVRLERKLLKDLAAAPDFPAQQRVLASISFESIGRKKKGDNEILAEQVKALRESWKKGILDLRESFLLPDGETLSADLKSEAETIGTVIRLVREFTARFTEKKRQRNLLDFNDLEHLTLTLLWKKKGEGVREKTPLAEEYAESFREIYVDEYQDSNGVQEALLKAVEHGELFLVGDVKQSIYAFRQAKPALFSEKYRTYAKYTEDAPVPENQDTRVDLFRNFRSRPEVLDTVNRIFRKIMDRPVGGIVYDEDAALRCGAVFPEDPGRPDAYVPELILAENASESDETQAEIEAELAAARIREMTDPENGLKVTGSDGTLRPLRYGDIAILLRSASGRAESFVNVLMGEGIPAEADQQRGYFDTPEVKMVLSLLTAADNPLQDIPLAASLLSPVGGLTETELALLLSEAEELRKKAEAEKTEVPETEAAGKETPDDGAAKAKHGGTVPLYERLLSVRNSERYPGAAEKVRRLFAFLRTAAEKAEYLSLPEFIRNLMEESGCYDYAAALPGGAVRKANLDMLTVKAGDFESTGYRGLYDFIRYIETLKKYDKDSGEADPGESRGDAVRVMTIHKSKGLEFPVVFLCNAGKKFNKTDLSEGVITDEELGLAADAVDFDLHTKGSTVKKRAVARKKETELLGEELRILYVALTRAKEKLVVLAAVKDAEKKLSCLAEEPAGGRVSAAEIRKGQNYLDWILLAMREDGQNCGFRMLCPDRAAAEEEELDTAVRVLNLKEKLTDLLDRPAGDEIRAAFADIDRPYPCAADVTLTTKRSVSELKFRGQDADDDGAVRSGFAAEAVPEDTPEESGTQGAERKNTAAEKQKRGMTRGTVYHRVMEKLDYKTVTDLPSLREFLLREKEKGVFTEEEYRMIRPEDFTSFLASDLCRRMAAARTAGVLHREAPFVMALPARETDPGIDSDEPVMIQGVIDAWFPEEGKIILVDYKTDRGLTETALSDRYGVQLSLYARALRMMEEAEVSQKIIWSFALGKEIAL